MPKPPLPQEAATPIGLRSGAAARLAGLPVTTLRVWERRYSVVAAPKTATGQRLYSNHDVQRLRLLKRLTDSGHAIGTIAALALEPLEALAGGLMTAAPPATGLDPRLVVVGRGVAQKLTAFGPCQLLAVHDQLDQAEVAPAAAGPVDVLLVHLASLQPAGAQRVLALAARLRADAVVVLYAFGAEAVVATLDAAGATVRREPIAPRELAQLVAPRRRSAPPGWQATPRRFSDEALAGLMQQATSVACECPRHLAEIVLQLVGFERYSGDCLAASPADSALHLHLGELAAAARAHFELALMRVVAEEGLATADAGGASERQ